MRTRFARYLMRVVALLALVSGLGGTGFAETAKTSESPIVIGAADIEESIGDKSKLLGQLRAVAVVRDGSSVGLRLYGIRTGSIWARMGLEDGDIVLRAGDEDVVNPASLYEFLGRLGKSGVGSVTIERRGSAVTKQYEVSKTGAVG
jgi:type II secretory pathway component PulC